MELSGEEAFNLFEASQTRPQCKPWNRCHFPRVSRVALAGQKRVHICHFDWHDHIALQRACANSSSLAWCLFPTLSGFIGFWCGSGRSHLSWVQTLWFLSWWYITMTLHSPGDLGLNPNSAANCCVTHSSYWPIWDSVFASVKWK